MKKILVFAITLFTPLTLKAANINFSNISFQGISFTPNLYVGGTSNSLNEKTLFGAELDVTANFNNFELGFGSGILSDLTLGEKGKNIPNKFIGDNKVSSSSIPLYVVAKYNFMINNNSAIVTSFKIGTSELLKDKNYLYNNTSTKQVEEIDFDNGLYMGLGIGYAFKDFIVSIDYKLLGITTNYEAETFDYQAPITPDVETSSTKYNNFIGITLSYKLNIK